MVAASAPTQLLRALGLWETTAIVIGIMIGTGIFIVPAQMTRSLGSKGAVFSVWAVTGLLSLFGALSFAELAAMMPEAGGQYVFLREAYGPLTGYLCGWSFFVAAQTGGIAVLAVGFAEYANEFLPLTRWEQKAAAAASIAVLTAINYRGVREGGALQSILTGLKLGAIAAFALLGWVLVRGLPGGPFHACGTDRPPVRGFFRSGDGRRFLGLRRLECLHVRRRRSKAPGAQRAPGVDPGDRGGHRALHGGEPGLLPCAADG